MAKLLFTDFVGTLVNTDEPGEEQIRKISGILNEYLGSDNQMVIISSAYHEADIYNLFSCIIEEIGNSIDNRNISNLHFYISGNLNSISQKVKLVSVGSKIGFIATKEIFVNCVEDKTFAINQMMGKKYFDYSQLFALGNDYADLPMLGKILDMNGKSSFIFHGLEKYLIDKTLSDKIVDDYIELRAKLQTSLGHSETINKADNFKRVELIENEERERINRLLALNQISLSEILKKLMIMDQLSILTPVFAEFNFPLSGYKADNLVERSDQMDAYSSFADYYEKVLKIKP